MQATHVQSADELHNPSERSAVLSEADLQDLLNTPSIDIRLLLENCMGKPLFAVSLLEEFARTAISRLEEFEEHLRHGNQRELGEMAHALKGVAGILGANALVEISLDIEATCWNSGYEKERLARPLRNEIQRILQAIPSLCARLKLHHAERG